MKHLIRLAFFIAASVSLANVSISMATPIFKHTVCYYSFDMERYVPFNEQSMHTADCYAISDDEFSQIVSFLKDAPTADASSAYQANSLKALIYNDSSKMYVDENGIVKIDESTFKIAGAKSMRNIIQTIIKNKPKLPRSKN